LLGTVVAYNDNAAVMEGGPAERWLPQGYMNAPQYGARPDTVHVLMKVETHNHPTAISPFAGAATGAGGIDPESGVRIGGIDAEPGVRIIAGHPATWTRAARSAHPWRGAGGGIAFGPVWTIAPALFWVHSCAGGRPSALFLLQPAHRAEEPRIARRDHRMGRM